MVPDREASTESSPDIRVLIADDHPVVRSGLRAMLNASGVQVAGEASSGSEAAAKAKTLHPDIVLMDVHMPDMDGLTATRLIKKELPTVAVVMVTSFESEAYLRQAIAAGAAGYLLKGTGRDLLLNSLRVVRDGGSIFDLKLLGSLGQDLAQGQDRQPRLLDVLVERELLTLRLVAQGMTNREIADELGYSVGTIKNVVQEMIAKLGVSDRTQAAVLAIRAGLNID